ncbi:hypothetical protein DFH07DRAFT_1064030 [Mycena maculata]|uniref:Carrier domain-containing protein n=1 Tax=Mycena maculata TaxID=230809 RepID=A0AAD7N273_9AGAR|nr:hypothetical protein DFH07DRAFT_1064030 [Mycena maculata]
MDPEEFQPDHKVKSHLEEFQPKNEVDLQVMISELLHEREDSPFPSPSPSVWSSETGECQSSASSISSAQGSIHSLSSAQTRVYAVQQTSPNSSVFNEGLALKIHGPASYEHIRSAIRLIVCRHDILRTKLVLDDQAETHQEVVPFDELMFDRMFAHETLRPSEVVRRVSEIYAKVFDLFEPPLVRMALLSSGDSEHVLVVCAHHIIWDEFSARIFTDELSALYQRKTLSPAASYFDSSGLQAKPDANHLNSLVSYLSSAPQLLELPVDFVRLETRVVFSRRGSVDIEIGHCTVNDLANRLGGTSFSTLMTAFAVTLHLCAACQEEFTVGVPFANRPDSEAANAIGLFINMLPLRVRFTGIQALDALHAVIQQDLLFLAGVQDVPFDAVTSSLGVGRLASRDSWMKAVLKYTDAPEGELDAQTRFSRFPLSGGAARTDLICSVEAGKDGTIRGKIEYDTGIFAHDTMESLAVAFNHILVAWGANPLQTIDGLALVQSSAHVPLVPTADPADNSFGAFLVSRALGFSDRKAVYDDTTGTTYTYRELYSMAKRVQESLRASSRANGMVLLLLERNVDVVVAEIGTSLAGLPWIPCDIFQPLSRIQDIMQDANPVCILAHQQVLQRLGVSESDFSAPVLFIHDLFDNLEFIRPEDIVADNAADIAYMIYTSGSTGKPKGIAIGHFSIIQLVREMIGWTEDGTPYNCVATSNVAWDAMLIYFYSCLATGGCVKLPKIDGEKDGEYLSALMKTAPISNTAGAPSAAMRMWLDQTVHQNGSFFPDDMHHIWLGGDEVSPTFVCRVFAALSRSPAARVQHSYGPTEGTVYNSYGVLTREDLTGLSRCRRTPIEKLIPNAAMTVVNRAGNELPRGFVGEIIIWGPCLLLQYRNRPELNRERFLVKDGIRGWRSGDLGRHLPCGKFEIFGRMDSMCKIKGGFRVELGEINAQIRSHPDVIDCYVSVYDPIERTCNLPLPTKTIPRSKLTVSQNILTSLFQHLSKRIPTYMIPDYVVQVETLLLPGSSKVDKTKLPPVGSADRFQLVNDDASVEWSAEDQARRSTVEAILRIFATVLSIDRELLPQDNFYNCGGHSLIATQVTNLIRRALDVPLPFTAIVTHPTASELAQFVDSLREDGVRELCLPPNINALQPSGFIREPRAVMVVFPFMSGLENLPRIANKLDNEKLGIATYGQVFYPISERSLQFDNPRIAWEPGRNLNTFDTMADAYAQSISALAGPLPCFLLGWCYGGMIATRVSQRLPQATTHAIFIEVPHPNEMHAFELSETDVAEDFAIAIGAQPNSEHQKKIVEAVFNIEPDWHDIPALVAIAREHGNLPQGMTDEDIRQRVNALPDAYDVAREIHGPRRFEAERRDMEACVALHLQARDGMNRRLPGIPVGLGWEKYEILEDGDHDTVGYTSAAQARILAVVRRVLSNQAVN